MAGVEKNLHDLVEADRLRLATNKTVATEVGWLSFRGSSTFFAEVIYEYRPLFFCRGLGLVLCSACSRFMFGLCIRFARSASTRVGCVPDGSFLNAHRNADFTNHAEHVELLFFAHSYRTTDTLELLKRRVRGTTKHELGV